LHLEDFTVNNFYLCFYV